MLTHLRPAIVMVALFTLLTGVAYPLAVTAIAQLAMPHAANGSLIRNGGVVVGSGLIGQAFTSDRYFQGRPSATSGPDPKDATKTVDAPYNAGNSSGSNLGPTSKKLIDRVQADAAALRKASGAGNIPADAVTTSASGLDPHISPAFALLQVGRVATARGVPEARIREILNLHVEGPFVGVLGEPRINVLGLNRALDAALAPRV
ncbi:MAG: potassium-transporting ATPase subunit KdpC [Hyphomicrobiaceae bacterium]